jgi:hypothetical protein
MSDYPSGIPAHICDLFEELTFQVYRVGLKRYAARAILHEIRWQRQIIHGDIHFKVNNNYSARLSRWFMRKHPKMTGFFEIRNRAEAGHNMHGYRHPDTP